VGILRRRYRKGAHDLVPAIGEYTNYEKHQGIFSRGTVFQKDQKSPICVVFFFKETFMLRKTGMNLDSHKKKRAYFVWDSFSKREIAKKTGPFCIGFF